jgi:hypothetical protein
VEACYDTAAKIPYDLLVLYSMGSHEMTNLQSIHHTPYLADGFTKCDCHLNKLSIVHFKNSIETFIE